MRIEEYRDIRLYGWKDKCRDSEIQDMVSYMVRGIQRQGNIYTSRQEFKNSCIYMETICLIYSVPYIKGRRTQRLREMEDRSREEKAETEQNRRRRRAEIADTEMCDIVT